MPVKTGELTTVISRLKKAGIRVYGSSLSAEKSYKEVDLSAAAIIIGSEANGISDPVLKAASCLIKIPMMGKVESLNAAVSAAVLLFAEGSRME